MIQIDRKELKHQSYNRISISQQQAPPMNSISFIVHAVQSTVDCNLKIVMIHLESCSADLKQTTDMYIAVRNFDDCLFYIWSADLSGLRVCACVSGQVKFANDIEIETFKIFLVTSVYYYIGMSHTVWVITFIPTSFFHHKFIHNKKKTISIATAITTKPFKYKMYKLKTQKYKPK